MTRNRRGNGTHDRRRMIGEARSLHGPSSAAAGAGGAFPVQPFSPQARTKPTGPMEPGAEILAPTLRWPRQSADDSRGTSPLAQTGRDDLADRFGALEDATTEAVKAPLVGIEPPKPALLEQSPQALATTPEAALSAGASNVLPADPSSTRTPHLALVAELPAPTDATEASPMRSSQVSSSPFWMRRWFGLLAVLAFSWLVWSMIFHIGAGVIQAIAPGAVVSDGASQTLENPH